LKTNLHKTILLLIAIIYIATGNILAQNTGVDFSQSFTRSLRTARIESKPIFAFVYTDWSAASQKMFETTFADSTIIHEIHSDYVPVAIDASRKTRFAKEHDITIFPAYVFFDQDGNILFRELHYKNSKELMQTLSKTKSNSRYLRENLDSLVLRLNKSNVLQTLDSISYYRDDYSVKNLVKKYLDNHKKEWDEPQNMSLLQEYVTLDEKYMKYVSRNHKVFFLLYDSLRIKENISFKVFLNSLKSDARGRPVFNFKPLKRWFRRYKISDLEKMEDFIKIKYCLWGRGPSVNNSVNLLKNYPETSNDNVLYSSVIRLLINSKRRRRPMDFEELAESLESSIQEGTSYWRYDLLSLLYYKNGDDTKSAEAISTAKEIASIIGQEYEPTLDFIKDKIER
jgi:L-rhamnose mutarotase